MDLYNLIPNTNDTNWMVKGKFLMYRKYSNVPVCYIDDGVVYVFLDAKIRNIIFRFIEHLIKLDIEFYFTSPIFSNPKAVDDPNSEVIKHYLYIYSVKEFFHGFKKINFDLIDNMVKWTEKEKCFDLVKPLFDNALKNVMSTYTDWYVNKQIYNYPVEIREEFQSLYRDIQISKLLS